MGWTRTSIPRQDGRIAVVTGANGGLGLAMTKDLARLGAHVVMACRDQAKAARAVEEVRRGAPDGTVEVVELDLGSLASVERAAATILSEHDRIDLLCNNAGLMAMPERRTEDGFEMQLGVNHLGHWALTSRLLPRIVRTAGARVVTVTSTAQHMGRPVDPADPHLEEGYRPWLAYGRAKLANRHFGVGLQREFERAGVDAKSLVAHPGFANTDLQARTTRENAGNRLGHFFHRAVVLGGMAPDVGVLSQLRAATDPDAPGGGFYGPIWVTHGGPVRKPLLRPGTDEAIRRLWELSERETGLRVDAVAARAGDR